jgi:hypothetical protein
VNRHRRPWETTPMLGLARLLRSLLVSGFGACGEAIIAMPR